VASLILCLAKSTHIDFKEMKSLVLADESFNKAEWKASIIKMGVPIGEHDCHEVSQTAAITVRRSTP
jgi:hypothetical protein